MAWRWSRPSENVDKKAGALNQQLARLLPTADVDDVVLVMDADSTINPDFLEVALGLLERDPDLIAVGGLFYGDGGGRLVGQLQRNEFTRYQRIVARKLNRVFVLTGTASVIRNYALRAVAEARGTLIPGTQGQVYDTLALTEDNELTLALKTLGARLTSPPECRVTTEVMTRWRDLWRQRLRWHRGALENLGAYGPTRATALYWTQQTALAYGVVALWSYLLMLVITLLAADSIRWSPFWDTIGIVFLVERLVTVWAVGWRGRLLAAPIFVELAYALFLQVCFVTSIVQMATGREAGWNYVPRPALQGALLVPFGILLPASILTTDWYQALCLWVGFNTLVFAFLSLLQLFPPASARVAACIGAPRADLGHVEGPRSYRTPVGADVDGGRSREFTGGRILFPQLRERRPSLRETRGQDAKFCTTYQRPLRDFAAPTPMTRALLESRLTRWPGEFIHIRTILLAKVSADAPGARYQAMFSEA